MAATLATLGLWAIMNQPSREPKWPDVLQGVAFSPYRAYQDPTQGDLPSVYEIDTDLKLLEGKTNAVRTYTVQGPFAQVPRLAAEHGINVMLGAWLDTRLYNNEKEIKALINLANAPNVVRVVVGNETLLRRDLTPTQLIYYLDRVKKEVTRPVSTAETWDYWLRHPELADHVDYLAVHILPFWEGVSAEKAVLFASERMDLLAQRFPDKPIVIAEVGWPSDGRTRGEAVASTFNEAMFLRRFLRYAESEDYVYYVMEAFDQPWKAEGEGAVGAYWGIYDVERKSKFKRREPLVRVPQWQQLAGISVGIGLVLLALLYATNRQLKPGGHALMAGVVYGAATISVWVIYDFLDQYLTMTNMVVGAFLLLSMLGVIAVLLIEAQEWAEAHWVWLRRRTSASARVLPLRVPKVSIHVPAYNEPPDLVNQTLQALSRLNYPDFEVVVVDNNTPEDATWRPVEACCEELGPRFRFFHVAPLAGFKAGALNFALRRTADDAALIAVIDADYTVDPNWLNNLVGRFEDPDVAIVQAPQDYRDYRDNAFKAMCYAEYRGFFYIGMITRNERNAIIQHGTMTLVRRAVLQQLGGWSEWCITEDAELGLRVFAAGADADYVPQTYGQGLMPDTFLDFKKQRHRWAYGAVQILKRNLPALLFGWRTQLTFGQRYHFLAGWLPWLADGLNVLFTLGAMFWSTAMILYPHDLEAPVMAFSALPLALFLFKITKLAHLYMTRVGANVMQTLGAGIAGLSLSHTIGLAVLRGIATSGEPFFRTPKCGDAGNLWKALYAARDEVLLMSGLLTAAYWLDGNFPFESPDKSLWVAVLLIQSLPYAATVLMALVSVLPLPGWLIGKAGGQSTPPPPVVDVPATHTEEPPRIAA